ncbi:hypothetical protein LOTGIDRAFT_147975, partial [Lottia gigantea]
WYRGAISRKEAERQISTENLETGTFLLRTSESCPGSYVLTVRDHVDAIGLVVRHYKIRNMDNGGCYITYRQIFRTILKLIEYYKSEYLCLVPF